ncbi:nSTAND1 domain-containing NTPase [Streptomyces sp. NPDC054766]
MARYEPADAQMFFGRDRLTADLLRLARDRRVCAVIGPSGSGATALVGRLHRCRRTVYRPGRDARPSPRSRVCPPVAAEREVSW